GATRGRRATKTLMRCPLGVRLGPPTMSAARPLWPARADMAGSPRDVTEVPAGVMGRARIISITRSARARASVEFEAEVLALLTWIDPEAEIFIASTIWMRRTPALRSIPLFCTNRCAARAKCCCCASGLEAQVDASHCPRTTTSLHFAKQ